MSSLKVYDRFQLEALKLGRTVVFQVTVFERQERGKTRLFAETECSDPLQHLIQFVIRDAPDVDGVIDRFVAQLVHRGFKPLRHRGRIQDSQKWAEWRPIEVILT
jgi:hypothetical protein